MNGYPILPAGLILASYGVQLASDTSNKLEVNKQKKLKIKAANGATMECSDGFTTTGQHRVTKTSTDIEMKVSKELKDEVLVSYQDLVDLK